MRTQATGTSTIWPLEEPAAPHGLGTPASLDRIGSQHALARRQPLPSASRRRAVAVVDAELGYRSDRVASRDAGVAKEHGADAAGWRAPRRPLAGH
jgi:hypothetical protein